MNIIRKRIENKKNRLMKDIEDEINEFRFMNENPNIKGSLNNFRITSTMDDTERELQELLNDKNLLIFYAYGDKDYPISKRTPYKYIKEEDAYEYSKDIKEVNISNKKDYNIYEYTPKDIVKLIPKYKDHLRHHIYPYIKQSEEEINQNKFKRGYIDPTNRKEIINSIKTQIQETE